MTFCVHELLTKLGMPPNASVVCSGACHFDKTARGTFILCLQVVCSEDTLLALNKAKAEGSSTWRVSSTVFGHIASDQVLTPLGHFATAQATQDYPAVDAGKFVQQELEAIKLKQR